MPFAQRQPLSDEVQEQLFILENSQSLIRSILLGITLQYEALDQQKCLLLENSLNTQDMMNADACSDPKSLQIAASLIVLNALFGFQKQAEDIACRSVQAGSCPDWTEPQLNATVILVALIRLCRLLSPKSAAKEEMFCAQEDLEALEASADPDL